MNKLVSIFIFCVIMLFTGCAIVSNTVKTVPYHSDDVKFSKFYVLHQARDKRNIDLIIADTLVDKGYVVSHGNIQDIPKDVDILVTYEDRWFWDMSNYLLKLNIEFRDAKDDNYPIMINEDIRTSLARRTVKTMVEESLEILFTNINKKDKSNEK